MSRNPEEIEVRESIMKMIEARNIINNRYSDIKRLDRDGGRGNFSILFSAYDSTIKDRVALKLYNPLKASDIDRVERFRREADILLKLRGKPNILECVDSLCSFPIRFIEDKTKIPTTQYYEFIPTKLAEASVEDYIYSRNSKPLTCLYIFREMCKGVARLHREQMCHRDLKPGNFLVFKNNDICVSDFGCAKYLDGSMPEIRSEYLQPIGDINYCSPELIFGIGIADEYSYKSDMFALGIILFEMFSKVVFTSEVYPSLINDIRSLYYLLASSPKKERTNIYLDSIKIIASKVNLPDIYGFNDFTPACIKFHLNKLYKSLAQIDLAFRLGNFNSIYRQIDICIITLQNEKKYLKWLKKKKLIRVKRMKKMEN